MGLELVELLMAVETEFGVTIPEAEAEKLARVGALHDFIVKSLRQRSDQTPVVEAEVWSQLVRLIVAHLGTEPARIHRDAYFTAI